MLRDMPEKPARSASSVFMWTVIGVAVAWSAIWNGLITALPDASMDPGAGPVLGFIFGVVAGGAAAWRRSRGKTIRPVLIGVAVWFVVFGIFLVVTAPQPTMP
jgi:hypothetical protein